MDTEALRLAADGLPAAAWWNDGSVAVAEPDPLTGPTEPVAPYLSRLYGDGERVPWCDLCGAFPARELHFRIVTSLVLLARWEKQERCLCRTCGLGLGRRAQTATLRRGWWSPIALVLSVWALVGNARGIRRAALLPEPERPQRDPHPPVRSVWRHRATIVPVVVLALLGLFANIALLG